MYQRLMDPDLYVEMPVVARFVEAMNEPEIQDASQENVARLQRDLTPTDDINGIAETLASEARNCVITTGTLTPQFVGYLSPDQRIKINPQSKIPKTPRSISRFMKAGKALALTRTTHCIFFCTLQPIKNGEPIVGDDITDICPWGVMVIGSSLRGNCFVHLEQMFRNKEELSFRCLYHKILREGQYEYPFSKFLHIQDHNEMAEIITQASKFNTELPEKECLINVATTLKALDTFGYSIQS